MIKKLIRRIGILSSIFLSFLSLRFTVYADTTGQIQSPTNLTTIGEVISNLSKFVAPVAVLGFLGSVIYAGYIRMFAMGNPDKEAKSMKIAVSAAIGFAIIALAPVVVRIIANILHVPETFNQ